MTGATEVFEAEGSQRFNIKDGQRALTFVGWRIAEADSQGGTDARWTELVLYRTLNNRYVLEKIGRSDIFHTGCRPKNQWKKFDSLEDAAADLNEDTDPSETFVQCSECHPLFEDGPVWVEQDIAAVALFESPEKLVQSLFRRDKDDMKFLSRVSRALLDEAVRNDEGIKAVVSSPADVT